MPTVSTSNKLIPLRSIPAEIVLAAVRQLAGTDTDQADSVTAVPRGRHQPPAEQPEE